VIRASTVPLTVTLALGFVVFSPSTIKIPAVVEVTDPVLVTSRRY
jgi:hypothetical protein